MTRLERILTQAAAELDQGRQRWALLGGLAVSARTEPRFTRDVDLAVAVADDPEAEAVVRALQQRGYRVHSSVEQEAAGRLATIRLIPPDGDDDEIVVDLLFASSGIEAEIVAHAERIELFPGLTLPVARSGHLLALKLLSRDDETRPQDAADIRALRAVADESEWALARGAVHLIEARGYARGRDLRAALDALAS